MPCLLFVFQCKPAELKIHGQYVYNQENKDLILLLLGFPSLIISPVFYLPVIHLLPFSLHLFVAILELFLCPCSPFRIYIQRMLFLFLLSELLKHGLCIHGEIICFYILLYVR